MGKEEEGFVPGVIYTKGEKGEEGGKGLPS